MDIPFASWYMAIEKRQSRRRFVPRTLEPELRERMRTVCEEFRPFPGTRAVLIDQSPDSVFKGLLGHCGKIKGATAFIAYVGSMDSPNVQEKLGYMGEGIILEDELNVPIQCSGFCIHYGTDQAIPGDREQIILNFGFLLRRKIMR